VFDRVLRAFGQCTIYYPILHDVRRDYPSTFTSEFISSSLLLTSCVEAGAGVPFCDIEALLFVGASCQAGIPGLGGTSVLGLLPEDIPNRLVELNGVVELLLLPFG